jgi:hypothetical protein
MKMWRVWVVLAISALGLLGAGYIQHKASPWEVAGAAPDETPPNPRFSRQEFANHVDGLTKGQIREQFGLPDSVSGDGSEWTYNFYNPGMTSDKRHPIIYDPDSGRPLSVTIQFYGAGGLDDPVLITQW